MTIRTTFALDPETVESLERLAAQWGVSKSEALRRSVASAAASEGADPASDTMTALRALQKRLGLTRSKAQAWHARVRAERKTSR